MAKRAIRLPNFNFKVLVPLYLGLALVFALLIKRGNVQLLEPAGYIAVIQSKLLWGVLIFMVLMGAFILSSFYIVMFRYRADKRRRYEPDWTAGKALQSLAWGIPLIGIAGLSVIVWNTAHMVDPYRPISANVMPVNIEVVALQWKWLFLYPDNKLATINQLEIPVNTPVAFKLTAQAPMNSFWIPRLSGQVYAMNGMVTQLHIEANQIGTFTGSPAEISGADYAGMFFNVRVVSAKDYVYWLNYTSRTPQILDFASYTEMTRPSSYVPPSAYQLTDAKLFDVIVMQYMEPGLDPSTLEIRGTKI